MKFVTFAACLLVMVGTPVWAAESGSFDLDQPFRGLSQRFLERFLNEALEALDDHFDISGSLHPDAAPGDRTKRLQFKFYPEGKSKSDEHIGAEGWFGPSQDSGQQEFHFKFSVPNSSTESPADLPDNVL